MRAVLCLFAPLLLAGCGDDPVAAPPPTDAVVQAPLPEGFTLPADTQIASMEEVSTDAGAGTVVLLESTATPETLEAHFREQAEDKGFVLTVAENAGGVSQLHGEREDALQFDFAASAYEDGSTHASLAIGRVSGE